MEKTEIDLTREEAAIALSILLAFADDDPCEAEVVVMRKYYHREAVGTLQEKLENAGYKYPEGLKDINLRKEIAKTLQKEEKGFRQRTIAIALLLAEADGNVDQREMNIINKFSHALGVTLYDAENYRKNYLKEIGDSSDNFDITVNEQPRTEVDLTLEEAGIALSSLVAFSDDDPADEEIGVIREYYTREAAGSLSEKVTGAGYKYPEDLEKIEPDISRVLAAEERENQLKTLAIAHKVSLADGILKKEELAILEKYCIEFGLGLYEVSEYFKTTMV